jgi:hypothetical protein
LTISDGVNSATAPVTVTMVQPSTLAVDTCTITQEGDPGPDPLHLPGGPRYRVNREKWSVAGSCDLANNQLISVYLGSDIAPDPLRLIGTTRVDALGNWSVGTGNRTAIEGVTIPEFDPEQRDPKTPLSPTTKVHIISEQGARASSDFVIN